MPPRTDDQLQAALDALDDLTRHPGWALVVEHAQVRFGGKAFISAIGDAARCDTADAVALKVREVVGQRDAATALVEFPHREATVLKAEQRTRGKAKAAAQGDYFGPNVEVTL